MGLSFVSLKVFLKKPSQGQVIIEGVLSLLILLSFFYLLQELYKQSDESIEQVRLSSKTHFKR